MSGAELVEWVARTSWQVALLVLLVCTVQLVFRRCLSPRLRYGLWLLVVLRLCLPSLPESSLAPIAWSGPADESEQAASTAAPSAVAALPLGAPGPAGTARPRRTRPSAPGPAGPSREVRPARGAGVVHVALSPLAGSPPASEPDPARWPSVLVALWALGALVVLARAALGERAFRRLLRDARPAGDARLVAIHAECARALSVRRPPPLVLTSVLTSPALHGLRRPRLLLPTRVARELDDEALRHVLLHELAHFRRRDLWLAAALVLLRALYWFHPLVHLAFARLRADQESARDHEALCASASPAPLAYARTLLALLEEGRQGPHLPHAAFLTGRGDLRKRIQMIANFRRVSPLTRVTGALVCAALGWATLLSAAQQPGTPTAPGPAGPTASRDLASIVVERPEPRAAWKSAFDERLDGPLDAALQGVELRGALEWFRTSTGLNLVVSPRVHEEEMAEIELAATGTSARQVLNLICDLSGAADWVLHREAVYVGIEGELPMSTGVRFYRVGPILDQVGADYDERAEWLDTLTHMVLEHTGVPLESWDYDGVSIQPWNELLIVRHNDATHDQVHAFLDRVLNRGAEPALEVPVWRSELESLLARRLTLDTDDAELHDVARQLARATGATFVIEPDIGDELMNEGVVVSLNLTDVELGTVLDWIQELTGAHVVLRDGVFVLTRDADMRLEFYDIRDIERASDEAVDALLSDLIRTSIEVDSWDEDPRCSALVVNGMLLVNQRPGVQRRIADLIESMRRALID